MACLRMLARDNCADDINELSFQILGESTVHNTFKKFVVNISTRLFPKFVKLAKGKQLEKVLDTFAKIGLPGCVGSMDCTRVKWTMCPTRERWAHIGKEGFPTAVFLVIVDHDKYVQYVSCAYKGSANDVQICQNDQACLAAMHGSLENIEYELYNEFGEKYKCKGGYILVDGGFLNHIVFIEPDKFRLNKDSVLFSEWLESVRKDVECFFGILKKRWWWFRNGICYHDTDVLSGAFKTVCTLNNMIMLFDQNSGKFDNGWENVDWEHLNPDADDEVDLQDVAVPSALPAHDIDPTNDTIDSFQEKVTAFKVTMPKSVLKKALSESFVIQWIKNKLQWPKNMENSQRADMPLIRATIEMKRALYKAPSTLITTSGSSLGYGLFSKLGYRKNDFIASFRGIQRSIEEWNALCITEPHRKGYGIESSTHGVVLDCYDHYTAGLCIASASNSPLHCFKVGTKSSVAPNCRLVVPTVSVGSRKKFYLRAGIVDPVESPNTFYILPHTELTWMYGDKFEMYKT